MDLDIILWIGGMLFSLGIFAIKIGFGLGFSGMKWKGMVFTLSVYLLIFILIAVLSEQLIGKLEPVLKKGPYLHALIATGMMVWGIYLLRSQRPAHPPSRCKVGEIRGQNRKIETEQKSNHSSLLLLIPCPVCLTAMAFSTWAALKVINLPAFFVGLGLGVVFVILSVSIYFFLKFITHYPSPATQRVNLGLSMIAIGLYFILSLYLPAKIEEAKGIYQSFLTDNPAIALDGAIGVFVLLFTGLLIGFLGNGKKESTNKT